MEKLEKTSLLDSFFDVAKVVALAIMIALFIRVFAFQPFNIPSGSMKSTLLVGDYLFISKFSYGYSRYSFPFDMKLFRGRLFGSAPARGDVAVFHYKKIDYIKRVIGLPGDRVQMKEGRLYLNGKPLARKLAKPFITEDYYGHQRSVKRYMETMPNGKTYQTLDLVEKGSGDNTGMFTVPAGHYFMMGDNRDNSSDSRFNAPIGFVPAENLIGKAQFLYFSSKDMSRSKSLPDKFGMVRWRRLFTRIH
ncbi:MAG: signal peptidase I [Hyphomicrobiaceae bacterium]|nr:signal peptidase I [Hyphomicrobiaceae bacterium]